MKKLFALAVIATALAFGSIANAAAINITVTQQGTDGLSTFWDITANTEGGQTLGGIALLGNVQMHDLAVNTAISQISVLDSGLVVDVLGDGTTSAMSINNTGLGVVITNGPEVLLGVLQISNPIPGTNYGNVRLGDELYGYTALDANGVVVADVSLTVVPAPEPAAMLLLGVGLAGMALVRRKA